MNRSLALVPLVAVALALAPVRAFADEPLAGNPAGEPISPVVIADVPADEGVRASNVAFGVVSGAALASGIAFLVMAGQTGDDLAAVDGSLIIDTNNRLVLRQEQESQRIIGYTLIGVGVVAGTALAWSLVGRDDEEASTQVTLAPVFARGYRGLGLGARF